jgi:hypothetical protein
VSDILANVSNRFGIGGDTLKIFDAMVFKREIGNGCSVDVKMIDTLNDGIVLSIEENLVNDNSLVFITDFVNRHNLSLLLEHGRYFISTYALTPSGLYVWEN